jgi:hypothetical protein
MQELKTKVKAVAAAAAGALLVGSTMAAGFAYDLGDLPAPFVEDGTWNNVFVLGTGGTSRSGLATDLGAGMGVVATFAQQTVPIEEKQPTGLTGVALVKTTGGDVKEEDIPLFDTLASQFGATLDDNDIASLFDGEIMTDEGNKYDAHEEIKLGTSTLDQNLDDGVVGINIPSATLEYRFVFDDAVEDVDSDSVLEASDWTDTTDGTGVADIPILGNTVAIKSWTNTSIVMEGGKVSLVKVGEAVTWGDYTITVDLVSSSDNAGITVKQGSSTIGSEIIDKTNSKTIGGVEVKVENVVAYDDPTQGFAQLRYGEKLSETLSDGEEWPDDERWIVDMSDFQAGTWNKPILTLAYDPDSDADIFDNENLLASGEDFMLLYEGLAIKNKGFIVGTTVANDEVTISTEVKTGPWNAGTNVDSAPVIVIDFPDEWDIYNAALTTRFYDKVYLWKSGNTKIEVSAENDDGTKTWYATGTVDGTANQNITVAQASNGDTNFDLKWSLAGTNVAGNAGDLLVEVGDGVGTEEKFVINLHNDTSNAFVRMAQSTDGTADAAGLYYTRISSVVTNLGTNEDDYVTEWGVVVDGDVGNNLENSDKVVMTVPNEQQKVKVLIGNEAETTKELKPGESFGDVTIEDITVSGTIREAGEVVPIAVDVWKLDTEVTDPTSTNVVLLGGPTVNSWTKELGYSKENFKDVSGTPVGLIELHANAFGGSNNALVIAGYDAANTRMAGYVAAHYDKYSLDGMKATVKGTTMSDLAVS